MTTQFSLFPKGIAIEVLSSAEGASELRLVADESHWNAVHVLHGGAVFTLVDSGMAMAVMSLLRTGETCLSVEIKVNNIAPVKHGPLVARSIVGHRGRTLAHVESDVRTAHGRLVAKGLGTFFIRTPVTAKDSQGVEGPSEGPPTPGP